MIEAIASVAITLIVFAIGYGRIIEKNEASKTSFNEYKASVEKEIYSLKKEMTIVTDLRLDIGDIKKDIHYIKETIKKSSRQNNE